MCPFCYQFGPLCPLIWLYGLGNEKLLLSLIAGQDCRLTFRKYLQQKTRRQTKLAEKQEQEENKCEHMIMRGKYNENVSGEKLVRNK